MAVSNLVWFETILSNAVSTGSIGMFGFVSCKDQKLAKTRYAKELGLFVPSEIIFAIDYYGYVKKTLGLSNEIAARRKEFLGKQLKAIKTVVVYFASLKIEKITEFSPDFVRHFPELKRTILKKRGFLRDV